MAEALSEQAPLADAAPGPKPPAGTHRGRFRLAYVALAVVFWASIAVLAIVLTRGGDGPTEAWSSWQPKAHASLDRAGEIADRVAPLYRIAGGGQLTAVQAHAPEVQQSVPVEFVAVRSGITGQDVKADSTGGSIFYILCGLGKDCALASGTPSKERALLLRREALELALYTFKYGDADSVVAFLPPATLQSGKKDVDWALYFKRSDFDAELSRPLAQTLPPHSPLTPGSLTALERARIAHLTDSHAFATSFTAAQDGGAVLVLDPLTGAQ